MPETRPPALSRNVTPPFSSMATMGNLFETTNSLIPNYPPHVA